MAQKKFLYEVLVRGTSDGEIAGAHQIWSTLFTDDETGEVVTVKHGPATALDPKDVKALIADSFVGVSVQVERLGRELDEAKAKADDAEVMAKQQADRLDALASMLASANALAADQARQIEATEKSAADAAALWAKELDAAHAARDALSRELDVLKTENAK